jgi:hypothetical protein
MAITRSPALRLKHVKRMSSFSTGTDRFVYLENIFQHLRNGTAYQVNILGNVHVCSDRKKVRLSCEHFVFPSSSSTAFSRRPHLY